MEEQAISKEWLRSLLTGDWWREGVNEELTAILNYSQRHREGWLKKLLPGDGFGPGGLNPGTVEFSVPMSEESTVDLRNWVDMNIIEHTNSVFLDTTCLETARVLVEDGDEASKYLLPSTLLDLSTFITCAIMYDRIYHLQNPWFHSGNIRRLFGEDLFYELPVEDLGTDEYLRPYYGDGGIILKKILAFIFVAVQQWAYFLKGRKPKPWKSSYIRSQIWLGNKVASVQAEMFKEAWQAVLGRDVSLDDLFADPNRELGSWASPTTSLINDLREAALPYSVQFNNDFISESNHRAMFNHILAQSILELPYMPSSARWPFRRFLYTTTKDWLEVIREPNILASPSMRMIEQHYQAKADEKSVIFESDRLQLPTFLAVILNEIDSLEQIPERVAYWRKQAAPLRERRSEIDELLNDPKTRVTQRKKVEKALADVAEMPKRWETIAKLGTVSTIIIAVPAFFQSHPVEMAVVSLVLTAPQFFEPSTLERLKRRLFRRDLYFLNQIGQEIDELTQNRDILNKIKNLWNLRDETVDALPQRLESMRILQLS